MGKMKLEQVLDWVLELEIHYFTVYALSTENLNRPAHELEGLFNSMLKDSRTLLKMKESMKTESKSKLLEGGTLPESVNEAITYAEEKTSGYENYTFTVCLAYGSREEMLGAIKSIAKTILQENWN